MIGGNVPKKVDTHLFNDRLDAAKKLLSVMPVDELKKRDVAVVALSSGGVFVGQEVATKLNADLHVLLSENIYAPKNRELIIAKVSETQDVLVHHAFVDSFGIDIAWVYDQATKKYHNKIIAHQKVCRESKELTDLKNRVVVLIDECVETDITALLAIKSMISQKVKNVYIAVPVLDSFSYESLTQVSDGVYSAHTINDYVSVEHYYKNLPTPNLKELQRIINNHE